MRENENLFILGDSYSTYEGYIPEGYNCYYSDSRTEKPVVKGAEKTWWWLLADRCSFNIVLNDSFSGSTVCNTVRPSYAVESSFISRIDRYIEENFFTEKEIGTMLILGGTNDSWIDAPIGKPVYSDWTEDDLKYVLPAFCYLISRAKQAVQDTIVIINTGLKEEIISGFIEACKKTKTRYLCLKDIDKENGHPTELGMEQISAQLMGFLLKK